MEDRQLRLAIGCLLHDIGKIVYRSGDGRNHSQSGYDYLQKEIGISDEIILSCVRYHHGSQLKNAAIADDSLAYVTYFADNVAAAADRRESEDGEAGFDRNVPLYSVFNILNGNHGSMFYSKRTMDPSEEINHPQDEKEPLDESFYQKIIRDLSDNLKGITFTEDYINSLLTILEANTVYIPSSTSKKELPDISLYDHLKMTAAVGQCVDEVLRDHGVTDYKKALFTDGRDAYDEKWFRLFSIDISGIQSFIYSIGSEGALKGLRARSFYLEVMMEHMIDELLFRLNLTRANLVYCGGGHCYLLLPNTKSVGEEADSWCREVNQWLINRFDTGLFVASGSVECSAMDFRNDPHGSYSALFEKLGESLSAMKASRYTADEIILLNTRPLRGEHECRICRQMDQLDDKGRCTVCSALENSSQSILYDDFFAVSKEEKNGDLPLPGGFFLRAMNAEQLKKFMEEDAYVRSYTKNNLFSGVHVTTKLFVGNYTTSRTFEEYAKEARGIDRIAVARADVDNLGSAFVSGLPEEYRSFSRTATFSRQLSLFFKGYINRILSNGKTAILTEGGPRNVSIVYSGGDDLFLVGAWNEVIDAMIDIRSELERFTENTLHITAGIGLYPGKYPIHVMARETAELEDCGKSIPGKNEVVLFEPEGAYLWPVFIDKVLGEKYKALDLFFSNSEERGKAFLYRLLQLLRSSREKIQFARYVYLLSRLEPRKSEQPEAYSQYRAFSEKMCEWYQKEEDRRQLISAIYLYVYLIREEGKENEPL